MKKFVGLTSRDMEHLVITIDASLKIKKRAHFYLWAQGALQGFLPHGLLVCAHGDISRMRFKSEIFTCDIFGPKEEILVTDPANGLLPRVIDEWLRADCSPLTFSPDAGDQVGRRQLFADMQRANWGHVAAHGPREIQGEAGSFYIFARMAHAPSARDHYLIEMLQPYMHMALYRMLAYERTHVGEEADTTSTLLSKRELQVLHWVKNGKTNAEIGQILHLSPPTIKNHVQKIMRKLKVNNRAQAVSKAATLRLVAPGEMQ